jgi:hypothetical protein
MAVMGSVMCAASEPERALARELGHREMGTDPRIDKMQCLGASLQ